MFGSPIELGAARTQLELADSTLDLPMKNAHDVYCAMFEQEVERALAAARLRGDERAPSRAEALERRGWRAAPSEWSAESLTRRPRWASIARMPTAASRALEAPALARDTTFYFVVAFALTWLSLLPPSLAALGVISGAPESYMAAAPLAVFSPAIAAVLAARREGGWPAVRAMLRGLRAWRGSPLWLVLALTLNGLLFVAGRAVYGLFTGGEGGPWIYLPDRPEHFGAILFVPLCEEIGWRGFALPRLIARHGALRATAILGVLWGAWHLPMFVSVGSSTNDVLVAVAMIVMGNFVYTWLFRRTGGSLLAAVLLHLGSHLDNPTHALPESATPLHILTAAWIVLAIVLIAVDRRAFEGTSPEAPGTPPAL